MKPRIPHSNGLMFVIHRVIVALVALFALSAIPSSQAAPAFGVNLISNGNDYSTTEYNDANLDMLFTQLKNNRFTQISIRVIWQVAEPVQGSYNQALLGNLSRIADKAAAHGLGVMLDFHTLFNGPGTDSWMVPTWLSNIASAGTYNGESIAAVSMKQIFYDPDVRNAYCEMMKHYTWELRNKPAINYISILNEPYLTWNSPNNETYFGPTVDYLRSQVAFAANGKPIGLRFLAAWNPWCDDANKRIGTTVWQSLNYVAMNLYPNGGNISAVQDGTNVVACVQRAIPPVQGAGKKFIISEIGYDPYFNGASSDGSAQQKEDFWKWLFPNVINPVPCDLVLVWEGQNDGSFFPWTSGFNIFSSANTLTTYALNGIVPYIGTGGINLAVSKVYKIRSAVSPGLCVDVPNGTTGLPIQLWYDNGLTPQRWKLLGAGNGYYKLEPQSAAGTLLDDANGSPNNGNPIQTWWDNGYDSEFWKIVATGNGTFKLINKVSNKALDDPWGAGSPGDKLQQMDDNGTIAQQWIFEEAPIPGMVSNAGFEDDGAITQAPSGWTTWSNGNNDADFTEAGGYSGTYKLTHWKATAYQIDTHQILSGLPDGTYTMTAWVKSGGAQNVNTMYATNYNGTDYYVSIPNNPSWNQVMLAGINVTNGWCKIGFWTDGNAGNWSSYENVTFIQTAPGAGPVANPGFEFNGAVSQTPTGWTTWSNGNDDADSTETGGYTGTYKLTHWKATPYQVDTYQTLTGLVDGTYTMTAWVKSSGGQNTNTMYAKNYDGTPYSVIIPTNANWNQVTIPGIIVINGQCKIGFWADGNAGNWSSYDDVTFTRN